MKLYFVTTGTGCGLKLGKDRKSVLKKTLEEVGTLCGVSEVRIATKDDINFVEGMNGYNPQKQKESNSGQRRNGQKDTRII